tara:strand:+ start:7213 stop:7374 length:162 start_codon:yes stop_codon:yes gene_type:complete
MKTFTVTLYFKDAPVLEGDFKADSSMEAKGMARREAISWGWTQEVTKVEVKLK